MGSFPQDTVLQGGSFPLAAVLQELLQHGSLPRGAVLQEQAVLAWVPHGFRGPARKSAPLWTPLHRLQLPSGHVHLLWCRVLHGLQWDSASPWSSQWAAGESLLQHLRHLLPFSFTDFDICRADSVTLLSFPSLKTGEGYFLPVLKHFFPEAPPA